MTPDFNHDISSHKYNSQNDLENLTTTSSPVESQHAVPWQLDPRCWLTYLAFIPSLVAGFIVFTSFFNDDIEFIGQRGHGYRLTRGWCFLADIWIAVNLLLFGFLHLIDGANIYYLYPYRSMISRQHPKTEGCFTFTASVYMIIFIFQALCFGVWHFAQRELEEQWVLLGIEEAKTMQYFNIGIYLFYVLYLLGLFLSCVLSAYMRTKVIKHS